MATATGRKIATPVTGNASAQAQATRSAAPAPGSKYIRRYRDNEELPFKHARLVKIVRERTVNITLDDGMQTKVTKRTDFMKQIVSNVLQLANTGVAGHMKPEKKAFITQSGETSWDIARANDITEEMVIRSWMALPSYNIKFYITPIGEDEYESIDALRNDPDARDAFEALHGERFDTTQEYAGAMIVGEDGRAQSPLPNVTIPALPGA
jgi:hypothetical protein